MWSHDHQHFIVFQLPALNDNYIYLIQARHHSACIIVDPAEADPVVQVCRKYDLHPTHIINTHHHWDHTGANLDLKKMFGCHIIGHAIDAERIPGIDSMVSETQPPVIKGLDITIIDVPGHTVGHMAVVIDDALFCGDTLFGAGCGRIFEGSYAQMWHSLQCLASLPNATRIYCAHEYTLANLAFAAFIDEDNAALQARMRQDEHKRQQGLPTIPSTIALEKQTNPFLRPLNAAFRQHHAARFGIADTAADIFRDIRQRKDRW